MTEHDDAPEYKAAVERAKQYEAMAVRYVKKAMAGEAGEAQLGADVRVAGSRPDGAYGLAHASAR